MNPTGHSGEDKIVLGSENTMEQRISVVTLGVKDLDTSKRFYVDAALFHGTSTARSTMAGIPRPTKANTAPQSTRMVEIVLNQFVSCSVGHWGQVNKVWAFPKFHQMQTRSLPMGESHAKRSLARC